MFIYRHKIEFMSNGVKGIFHIFVHRFFISAPNVFHLGVKEKVLVQLGGIHLNNPVTLYLAHESGTFVSEKETAFCATEGEIKTVELMV